MSSQLQRSKVSAAVAAVLLLTGRLVFAQAAMADLDLPPQELAQSLRAVATATQVNVLFDTTQIAAFKAPALKGRITVADALSRLLDGTGLTYRFIDDKTVVLSAKEAISRSQTTAPSSSDGGRAGEEGADFSAISEVVVTGTRIARTAFDTPVPVTVMDEAAIQRTGFTNVTDLLGRMPALAKGSNPNNTVYDQTNVGASFADLRGLGVGRTLTLINGRRRVSGSANSAAVDLSTIPANMIERIEVITGGAAAVYGADAVSGVLNIILKENFDGLSLGARAHKPGYNGGAGHTLSVAGGAPFSDDRGSIGFTLSYSQEDRVSLSQLPWYKRNGLPEWVGNPANTGPDDGIPDRIALRDMREPGFAYGGAFEAGGVLYTVDPQLRPVQHGPIISGLSSGGDGWNPVDTNPSRAGSNSYTGMLSVKYRVAEDVRFFANADFGSARADSPWLPAFNYGVPLSRDNALLPAGVGALMDANGLDEIFVSKLHLDSGNRHDISRRNTYTAVVGLEGELLQRWNWQAFYQYGRFDRGSRGENYQNSSRFLNAIDVIADPQTGQPVCRDESARADGCVPISLLGRDVPSAEALGYVQHTLVRDLRNTQTVAGAQLTGELFTLPAGPAQLASGFEYRKETLSMRDDGLAVMGLIDQALGGPPVDAQFDVKEAFAELVVPIAADLPLLHRASLEGAARYSNYDTIGDTTTWKLGGMWAPFRDFRFRVMRAYSVRAPNLYELFSPGVFGFGTNYDPCSVENIDLGSASRVDNCRAAGVPDGWATPRPGLGANARTGGNPNLDPETSRSWTIGAVFTPTFAPRFSVSVDYWKIEIEKAVGTIDSDTIVTRCYDSATLNNPFCPNITRGTSLSPSEISLIDVTQINVGHLATDGVDLAAAWSFDAASLNARWPGSLSVSLSGTYLRSFEELVDASDPLTLVVSVGEVQHPKWRVNASVAYEQGPLIVDWGLRYVGASDFSAEAPERYAPSGVTARMYTDLVGTYRWSSVEAQLGINNLLGTEPPLFVGQNGGFYDIGGRMVFASVTMKL